MLGVCSSLQDQHFWLFNHSISSWNERVMIKTRNQKLEEIFCSLFFQFFLNTCLEGRMKIFKKEKEGDSVANQRRPHHPSPWETYEPHGAEGCWGREPHTPLTGGSSNGLWPLLTSLTLLLCSLAVFGHPNSEFESVFGLRTVTPSRTTTTTQLWKKGWEIISKSDDEVNTTNENKK